MRMLFYQKETKFQETFTSNWQTYSGLPDIYKLQYINNNKVGLTSSFNKSVEISTSNFASLLLSINIVNTVLSEECILVKEAITGRLTLIPVSHEEAQELINQKEKLKLKLKQGNEYIVNINYKKKRLVYLGIYYKYELSFEKNYKNIYENEIRQYESQQTYRNCNLSDKDLLQKKEDIAFPVKRYTKKIFLFIDKETNSLIEFYKRKSFFLEEIISSNNYFSIENHFKNTETMSGDFYTRFYLKEEFIENENCLKKIETFKKFLINIGALKGMIL